MRRIFALALAALLGLAAFLPTPPAALAAGQIVLGPGIVANTLTTSTLGLGNTESTMGSFTLPTSTLLNAGKKIEIQATWSTANNTDNKTMKLYFGSEVMNCTTSTSGQSCNLDMFITKAGPNIQIVWGTSATGTPGVFTTTGAETDTAPILIKATASTTTVNEATLFDFFVTVLN